MRLFIAIEISDQIRESLAQIQSHLKYAGADVKWVEPKNIHLTLKFLGEVKEEKIEEIKSALDEVAKNFKSFELSVKDIGAFPKIDPSAKAQGQSRANEVRRGIDYPRVIWAGLDKGKEESEKIAGAIDERLSQIGFQKESRPFASHLTIGRVRSSKNKDALKEKIFSYTLDPSLPADALVAGPHTLIKSITLFQSTLTPKGSIYTKLYEAKLFGYGNP